MKQLSILLLLLASTSVFSQTKNFIDLPYVETSANVDTLVTPDNIYLNIILTEKDTKGRISVEELENKMSVALKAKGIDIKKQLFLRDLASNFKKYFLKQKDILKNKGFSLLVYDAKTAGLCIAALEEIGISNVYLDKVEYSEIDNLFLILKSKAIVKAKKQAISLSEPLNQKIGNAIYISDTQKAYNKLSGKSEGIRIRGASSLSTKYEPLEIEFEKIKIGVNINAKFILLQNQ